MIRVRHKKERYEYPIDQIDSVKTLQKKLYEDTKVPTENQKLIVQGKRIEEGSSLENLLKHEAVLFGATKEEVDKLVEEHKLGSKLRIKDDLKENATPTQNAAITTLRKTMLPEYRFEDIRVLEGFSDDDRAYEILQSLAEDLGFQAVLAKHKWKVGVLSEMMPEGYVGVSEVCVLGVNKNKGQEISLRIRTDDLQGFRKILSIRQVLCHELAHMVYSEHDGNFFTLMRQIEKEVVELHPFRSPGRTLNSTSRISSTTKIIQDKSHLVRREKIALATRRRLQGLKEESSKDEAGNSASRRSLDSNAKSGSIEIMEIETEDSEKSFHSETENTIMHVDDMRTMEAETHVDEEKLQNVNLESKKDNESQATEKEKSPSLVDTQVLEGLPAVPKIQAEDFSQAIEKLCARNEQAIAISSLEVISKLVRNVLKEPTSARYRQVRMSNKTFHEKVLKTLSGRLVMTSMGWFVDEISDTIQIDNSPETLAMLVYAQSEIEKCIGILQCLD